MEGIQVLKAYKSSPEKCKCMVKVKKINLINLRNMKQGAFYAI